MERAATLLPQTLQRRLRRVAYIQPVREILHIQPLTCAGFLGFSEPLDIAGCFSHIGLSLLDHNATPLLELHGLAYDDQQGFGSIGQLGSRLECHALRPGIRSSQHIRLPGVPLEITVSSRAGSIEQLENYIAASRVKRMPYTIPADIVRNKISNFRDNFKPITEAGLVVEPAMALRRKYLCGAVVKLPLSLFAAIVRRKTGWPVRVRGHNSNSVAGDIGELFGINIRGQYSHMEAPLIGSSVRHWLPASPKAPRPKRPVPIPQIQNGEPAFA